MTTIYCSNKLNDFLGKSSLLTAGAVSSFWEWNAHLFYVARRKHLIFVNNQSRYCLIAEDILKSDLQPMNAFFRSRLTKQLLYDGLIKFAEVSAIEEMIGPVHLLPTNSDRSVLGTINEFVFQFKTFRTRELWIDQPIEEIMHLMNDGIVGIKGRSYSKPIDNMKRLLSGA